MRKFLLDRSPTGVLHYAHVSDDELITEEFTPSAVDAAVVDNCKLLSSLTQRKGQMQWAGQIPINLYQKWRKEWRQKHSDSWTWKTFLVMRMNSSEYKDLRDRGRRLPSHKHV